MADVLWRDVKHGLRVLAKTPGFTIVAVVSIAIGVGANAAMFSLADSLLLRPLPVPRPGEVITVMAVPPAEGLRNPAMSYLDYVDIRDRTRSLATLAAYQLIAVGFASDRRDIAQRRVGAQDRTDR